MILIWLLVASLVAAFVVWRVRAVRRSRAWESRPGPVMIQSFGWMGFGLQVCGDSRIWFCYEPTTGEERHPRGLPAYRAPVEATWDPHQRSLTWPGDRVLIDLASSSWVHRENAAAARELAEKRNLAIGDKP